MRGMPGPLVRLDQYGINLADEVGRAFNDLHAVLLAQRAHVALQGFGILDRRGARTGGDDASAVDPLLLGHPLVVQPLAEGDHVARVAVDNTEAYHGGTSP